MAFVANTRMKKRDRVGPLNEFRSELLGHCLDKCGQNGSYDEQLRSCEELSYQPWSQ